MPATPVDQFSALADATRCKVIEMLHERPMPVHELTAAFDISRPAISRHLRVLKDARLVKEEKLGRENIYSLQRQKLKPMAQWLERVGPKLAAKVDDAPAVAEAVPAAVVPPVVAEVAPVIEPVVSVEPVAVVAKPKAERKPRVVPPKAILPKAAPQMQLDLF